EDKKTIHHFQLFKDKLYLSTSYGISVYDPENKVFRDTYYLGPGNTQININQSAVYDSFLYAASEMGLYKIAVDNPSIIQSDSWTQIASGNWVGIGIIEDKLIGIQSSGSNTTLQAIDDASTIKNINGVLVSPNYYGNQLALTFKDKIITVDRVLNTQQLSSTADVGVGAFTSAISMNNKVYIGTASNGLIQWSGSEMNVVSPRGPLLNDLSDVTLIDNLPWVSHGFFDDFYTAISPKNIGISKHTSQGWSSIGYEEMFGAKSIARLVQDPNLPNTIYACSYQSGILVIEDEVPQVLWNETNSGLESLTFGSYSIRVGDVAFDSKGNLWSITALVEGGLKKRSPNGNWTSVDLTPVLGGDFKKVNGYSNIVITPNDEVFIGSVNRGLIGYKDNNGSVLKNLTVANNLPSESIRTLALDADNHLWIGTTEGLRVLYNASRFFEDEEVQTREIIVEEGGNLGELLNNQFITVIEVDGNNQKWIGTAGSGVFLFSEDGTETLQHFTKENSPLPTNSIRTIALDNENGLVYFGTPNGLVSFQGNAFASKDSFENIEVYPNPVRPHFSGRLTIRGLKTDSHVKITDISGHLVYETRSEGGSVQWDLRNFQGNRVRSGVYLIFVSDPDGTESAVEKVMIVN
ncbi:MAG: two-component regulator propeller domain-containing protein, partial [Flavobacteriaceae bacterium]